MLNFCTYFDSNYLVKGLALYNSLVRHAGAFKLWVLCLDGECYNLLKKLNYPNILPVQLSELEAGDEELLKAKKNRSKIEYYFTSTPSIMLYILKHNQEVDVITYLDSDLYFYSDISPLYEKFKENSLLIIEHNFAPHQKYSERHGKFNVGLVSIRRDENGISCLNWWRARCNEWCYDKVEKYRFADQKYLDQWPALFKGVLILKHKGANLAPWNLSNYNLNCKNGKVVVDEVPLIFFHFQGLKNIDANTYDTALWDYGTLLSPAIKNCIYLPYIRELEKISGEIGKRAVISLATARYAPTFRRILKLKSCFYMIYYVILNPVAMLKVLKIFLMSPSSQYIKISESDRRQD